MGFHSYNDEVLIVTNVGAPHLLPQKTQLFSDAASEIMCVCGTYHRGGMLVFSISGPDRRRLRNGLAFGDVLIPCCVCGGDSGEVGGRNGGRDLLCCALSAPRSHPPDFQRA